MISNRIFFLSVFLVLVSCSLCPEKKVDIVDHIPWSTEEILGVSYVSPGQIGNIVILEGCTFEDVQLIREKTDELLSPKDSVEDWVSNEDQLETVLTERDQEVDYAYRCLVFIKSGHVLEQVRGLRRGINPYFGKDAIGLGVNEKRKEEGVRESAGINRLGIENERVLQRKPSQ